MKRREKEKKIRKRKPLHNTLNRISFSLFLIPGAPLNSKQMHIKEICPFHKLHDNINRNY